MWQARLSIGQHIGRRGNIWHDSTAEVDKEHKEPTASEIRILQALEICEQFLGALRHASGLRRLNSAALCGRRCPASAHTHPESCQRDHELQVPRFFFLSKHEKVQNGTLQQTLGCFFFFFSQARRNLKLSIFRPCADSLS